MKILITGNMGYVGSCLVRYLRQRMPNSRLIGADLGLFGHCLTGNGGFPERFLDEQHFVDVRRIPEDLLAGVDSVIHLAAISNDPMGKAYEQATEEINCAASLRLASLCKRAGVRSFVFASSCSIYGSASDEARDEDAAVDPLTAYARSKVNAEAGLRDLADPQFKITSLRFPTACGMSDRLRLDLVLNDFVASAFLDGVIRIMSDGTPWRPLIDVYDMARAFEWATDRGAYRDHPFLAVNVGRQGINYQVIELAEAVRAQLPKSRISINKNAGPDKRSYRVDFSLYERLASDFLPTLTLQDSIAALVAGLDRHIRENKYLNRDSCVRLTTLSKLQKELEIDANLHPIRDREANAARST